MKVNWDLSHLYQNDHSWKTDYNLLSKKIEELKVLSVKFLSNVDTFLNYLKLKIEVDLLIEKVYCYPKRHLDIDSTLQNYKEMLDNALNLYSDIQKLNHYFENQIIDNSQLVSTYLKDKSLQHYQRYIHLILRRENHIPKETLNFDYMGEITKIRQQYQELFTDEIQFEDVTINGEKKSINRNNYSDLILDKNQENRKIIYDTYTNAYALANTILSELYISKLMKDIHLSKIEKYPTLLSKKLYELELSDKILDELIKKINENLHIMHQYTKLKKKISGLEEYHIYDTSISICDIPKMEYSLDESLTIIKNALIQLGEDYIQLIDKMFDEGWIDVYPKENKRTMSFSCISYVGVPYVLVNYNSSVNSARTLAHEIGHAVHTFYSKNNNPFEYFEFSYFLTEIASKVNEILVNEYMIQNSHDKQEKIYITNNTISSLGNSLFGQMMLTEFEHHVIQELSKGNDINNEYLNQLYMDLSKKYNGDSFTYDDNVQYGWSKIPHFIMQDTYYLYQYSIGTAIATNIAERILNGEENITEKYKKFLSLGNSVSIKEALKIIDIDLEDGKYLDHSVKILNKKINDMKKIIEK